MHCSPINLKKKNKKQKTTLKHTGFTKLRSDCKTRQIKYDSITAYFSPQIFSKIYLSDLFLTRPPSWKQMEEDREGHQNKEQKLRCVWHHIIQHTCGIFARQITKMIDQLWDLLTIQFSFGFSTIVSTLICTSSPV